MLLCKILLKISKELKFYRLKTIFALFVFATWVSFHIVNEVIFVFMFLVSVLASLITASWRVLLKQWHHSDQQDSRHIQGLMVTVKNIETSACRNTDFLLLCM